MKTSSTCPATAVPSRRRPLLVLALLLGAVSAPLAGCTSASIWDDITAMEASAPTFQTGWGAGNRGSGGHR